MFSVCTTIVIVVIVTISRNGILTLHQMLSYKLSSYILSFCLYTTPGKQGWVPSYGWGKSSNLKCSMALQYGTTLIWTGEPTSKHTKGITKLTIQELAELVLLFLVIECLPILVIEI